MAVLPARFIRLLLAMPFTILSPRTFALTTTAPGTLATSRRQHFWDAASMVVSRAAPMAVLPVL